VNQRLDEGMLGHVLLMDELLHKPVLIQQMDDLLQVLLQAFLGLFVLSHNSAAISWQNAILRKYRVQRGARVKFSLSFTI